jgi:hypothetical protein
MSSESPAGDSDGAGRVTLMGKTNDLPVSQDLEGLVKKNSDFRRFQVLQTLEGLRKVLPRSPKMNHSTFTLIPSEWLANSGAYMHWMVVKPLEKSPFSETLSGYSKTKVPLGK